MSLSFSDDELEILVRKARDFEETLGRMIRDKRAKEVAA